MSDLMNDVKEQHAKYSKLLGEKQTYLTQVKDQIKRLKAEQETVLTHINELIGAVNMGSQVIEMINTNCTECKDAAVEVVDGV